MGKASSAKKVARAARAGGHRTGQRRQLGFPIAVGAVVVLGLLMVFVARESGQADADASNHPKKGEHWHAAYGIYVCDHFVTNVADDGADALGIHTHQDGLVHIHPFSTAAAGKQANLGKFFDQTGIKVTNSSLKLPSSDPFNGRLYEEGKTTCGGKPGTLKVVHWKSALKAAEGAKATKTFTSDFRGIRLSEDLGAYTIAFVPDGAKVPAPPGAAEILQNAQNDQGAGQTPEDPGSTVPTETAPPASDDGSSTTAPSESSTTAPTGG